MLQQPQIRKVTVEEYIEENERRTAKFKSEEMYDPISGEGCCGERVKVHIEDAPIEYMWLPKPMLENTLVSNIVKTGSIEQLLKMKGMKSDLASVMNVWLQFCEIRFEHDFEFWAIECANIKDKNSDEDIKFMMNRGQRCVHADVVRQLEEKGLVRIIVDKARQWGCSTYCDMVCGWFSMVRCKQWNIVIAAHEENTARIIRGMYSKLLKKYPKKYWHFTTEPKLSPFEGSQKTRVLIGRENKITIGSAQKPESIVGDDLSAAHLSEVSRWVKTQEKSPAQMATSIISGISYRRNTLIIYESTGLGVGNYFYDEWMRAMLPDNDPKKSEFTPIFVPWFMIDYYELPIKNMERFINSMDEYERDLFEMGARLEQINFYRHKKREYADTMLFMQDYPSTWQESFSSAGNPFYNRKDIEKVRKNCKSPEFVGEIYGKSYHGQEALEEIKFVSEDNGKLKIWSKPGDEKISDRYVVVVDIGGASDRSDFSVICVFDRKEMAKGGVPEVVAEWCGHTDHDLLAWKSAQIATWYKDALLIIESNTLEHEQTEGDHFDFILDEIAYHYRNLYTRTSASKIREGVEPTWGFHTNKQTKQMVCDHHKKVLREGMYIERDLDTCKEYDVFERKDNGSLGAKDGYHDDKNITRAIGVWACYQQLSSPRMVTTNPKRVNVKKIRKGGSLAVI